MPCLLCGSPEADHRFLDPDTDDLAGEVCGHCADEHLLADERGPTCELCSELADYDLAVVPPAEEAEQDTPVDPNDIADDPSSEPTAGDDGADSDSADLEIVARDVICGEDLAGLKDAPAGAI